MIAEALQREAETACYTGGFAVTLSIPGGEEVARRTFNPHIGVAGGLSILGTSGIVEPMSQQAILDTIQLEMNQAALRVQTEAGPRRLILAPGNYGLDYLGTAYPEFASIPVVKTSNFIGDTLDMAASAGFEDVLLVGHVGKLCKLAGGIMNTHSHTADCRTELFCAHAALCAAGRPAAPCSKPPPPTPASTFWMRQASAPRCWKACWRRCSSIWTAAPPGRSGWVPSSFRTSTARWARLKRRHRS